MKTKLNFTAVFESAPEGGYIAFIEEIQGVNTQGETLEEAKSNLLEALELMLETSRMLSEKEINGRKVIRENIEVA